MLTISKGTPSRLVIIKENQLIENNIIQYYTPTDFLAIGVPMKSSATERKELIKDIIENYGTFNIVICGDPDWFKALTKVKKTSGLDGYPMKTELGTTFLVPNYASIFYNPIETKARLSFILDKIKEFESGSYKTIGNVIKESHYCFTEEECKKFLELVLSKPALTIDIETTGLHHYSNQIVSIGFAWDESSGGVIYTLNNPSWKSQLKDFFDNYKGTCIYHNSGFDITNLIYHLYMTHLEDFDNLLVGLHILCRDYEDTKLIAYLCKNTCGKASLSLKSLAHTFAGNYAEENIDDVLSIPMTELVEYNLTDCCATWFVYNTYKPMLATEGQDKLYTDLFLPTQKVLIETQLIGLRIYPDKLEELSKNLNNTYDSLKAKLRVMPEIIAFDKKLQSETLFRYNVSHKNQKADINELFALKGYQDKLNFNPRSNQHKSTLIYNQLKLPVVDTTDKGEPATGKDTLQKLINHTTDNNTKELLQALVDISAVDKIISAFMPNFEEAPISNGRKILCGSFNLGSTVSGRLSSSEPNLQQLPSTGSPYAKPVKKIFGGLDGYVFCGADFASLEDHISALLTKDANKLKVYTDHYDGHCLRAYSYFGDQMPDIHLAKETDKCYKITNDDGSIDYVIDNQ